jgi:hypothetical protein
MMFLFRNVQCWCFVGVEHMKMELLLYMDLIGSDGEERNRVGVLTARVQVSAQKLDSGELRSKM